MSKSTKDSAELPPSSYTFLNRRKSALFKVAASLTVCLMAYLGTKMNGTSNTEERIAKDVLEVDSIGNFELLKRINLNYTDVTITKWRSKDTGLKVVHVDYEGPIINGYFAVATESMSFSFFRLSVPEPAQYLTTVVAPIPSNTSSSMDLSSIRTPMRYKGWLPDLSLTRQMPTQHRTAQSTRFRPPGELAFYGFSQYM
jgi:hypothetical protein